MLKNYYIADGIMIYLEKENCFKNKAKKVLKIFNFCVLVEIVEFLVHKKCSKAMLISIIGQSNGNLKP